MLGMPDFTSTHLGIDVLGERCRVDPSVSVYRLPAMDDAPAIRLGDDVTLMAGCRLVIGDPAQTAATGIHMANGVIVNVGCYLSGEGGLVLEEDVLIGPHVRLLSAGHAFDGTPEHIRHHPLTYAPILVRRGAWIGGGATVLEGVTIGQGAVVGAGSVVTRDIPDFSIAVGNPARVIRCRKGFDCRLGLADKFRLWIRKLRR